MSAEVLTLPVAAVLQCTCNLEVATHRDCIAERFCLASTWILMDVQSVVTCRNVSLHMLSTDIVRLTYGEKKTNVSIKQGTLSETNY